jgi:hypothetical protein
MTEMTGERIFILELPAVPIPLIHKKDEIDRVGNMRSPSPFLGLVPLSIDHPFVAASMQSWIPAHICLEQICLAPKGAKLSCLASFGSMSE